jgi:hypothetical protein
LELRDCGDIDEAVVNRVLAVELGDAPAQSGRSEVVTTARAECRNTEVRLTIDDPITGKTTTRLLDLGGQAASLRSRLLGQAISEAVLASWIELEITPKPALPRSKEPPPPEVQRQVATLAAQHVRLGTLGDAAKPYELSAGTTAHRFGSGLTTFGFAVSGVRWLAARPSLGIGLATTGEQGDRLRDDLGWARATELAMAPRMLMRGRFGRGEIAAGVGWRVGLARLRAAPRDSLRVGRAAFAVWTGPFLDVGGAVELGRSFFACAAFESGHVVVPASGTIEGARVLAFDGSWFGGTIALGMRL